MSTDSRNTRIVACLIASMTLGAAVLLWLEPPQRGWANASLLIAENGQRIDRVVIRYQPAGEPVSGDYGCLVYADGQCDWQPRGRQLDLLVLGTAEAALSPVQARGLLMLLGNLCQGRRDISEFVLLEPDSDARLAPELPPQAHALTDLLTRKGIIR